jgi:hypothetical protein
MFLPQVVKSARVMKRGSRRPSSSSSRPHECIATVNTMCWLRMPGSGPRWWRLVGNG